MEESQGIAAEQFVLRRIPKVCYEADKYPPIQPLAFRPSREDVDGLSLYLESAISPQQLSAAGRKPGEYYVARLSVKAIQELQLTVVKNEEPGDVPGHVHIPEINYGAYRSNKNALKDLAFRLAVLASQNVVLHPES